MTQNFPDNTLYELANLDVLRGMYGETVDLIATDPPCKIPLLHGCGKHTFWILKYCNPFPSRGDLL